MVENFKKIWQPLVVFGFLISALYFLLRLPNLNLLPIFADEAIYIRWAQVMRAEPTLRFLPLSDGKQPLYMWLVMILLRFFSDPLFCGRLVSVMAGFGSLIGLIFLCYLLFKNVKIILISAFFYSITPFFIFFDRMALVDSLLMMLGIWVFALGILLARYRRLDLAMINGIILGLALVTKSPALFFALLLPATAIFIDLPKNEETGKKLLKFIKLISLWLIVYLFSFGIYNLLRLGPNFGLIAIRNKDYVLSLREILSHPLDPLNPHINDLKDWFPNLYTWPILLLSFMGIFSFFKDKTIRKQIAFLILITGVSILAQSVMARVFTSRYLLFASWPVLILAGIGLSRINKKSWLAFALALLSILPLSYDWRLLTNLQKAPLPRNMRAGYLEEWTAGYGIKEVTNFVNRQLTQNPGKIIVGTEGYFGTLPDGLQIYFNQNPRVIVLGVGQPIVDVPQSLLQATINNQVFLVVNQSRMLVKNNPHLILIDRYPKAIGPQDQDFLLLFQVK